VLVVAADRERCSRAANELGRADADLSVARATDADGVERALAETAVDCVVFAENPLTTAGSTLLEVVAVCRSAGDAGDEGVPVILFSDGEYGPGAARATEGVADYVRADGPAAYTHLADRVRWVASPAEEGTAPEALVESMDEGVVVVDADGVVEYANAAVGEVFGVDPDRLQGGTVDRLGTLGVLAEPEADAVAAAVGTALSGAGPVDPEVTLAGPDPAVVELRVVAVEDHEGALATVRNVTDHRETESALRRTRAGIERLQSVAAETGACRSERELFGVAVDAATDLLCADVCGVEAVRDGEFVPVATDGGRYGPTPVETGAGGRAVRAGESLVVADYDDRGGSAVVEGGQSALLVPVGGVGLLRAVARAPGSFDDRDRDLAELLVAHVEEALARVRVGETLRERERDLVAQRERLVTLFEQVPDPVVGYRFEGGESVVTEVNEAFARTFGVDADAVAGTALREHVRAPLGEDDTDAVDAALAAGETVERTVRRLTAGGERDLLVRAGDRQAGDREDAGRGHLVYTDVTDQTERERKLHRRSGRRDGVALEAAADLRGHLNEARGYLELAVETNDPGDVGRVRVAHERIRRLVADLDALARRPPAPNAEPLDLEAVTGRTWATVETGGADLTVTAGTVEADPEALGVVLERLVRFAVDRTTGDPLPGDVAADADLAVRVGPLDGGLFVEDTADPPGRDARVALSEAEGATDGASDGRSDLRVVARLADAHGWSVTVTERDGWTRVELR
jgi:PAS domain S-box-containing protein